MVKNMLFLVVLAALALIGRLDLALAALLGYVLK